MEAGTPEGEPAKAGAERAKPPEPGGSQAAEAGQPPGGGGANRRRLRFGIVALALVVGVVAWVASRGGDSGSSEPAAAEPGPPRIVTEAGLREAAASLGQPIYWAGPIAGQELELNELGDGGVQVRYLPEGTEAGTGSARSLTVGSYPLSDPNGAIEEVAGRPGEIVRKLPDGRSAVASEEKPTSVYFASPDNSVQVEVYDPSAKRAMSFALSERVQPVG